MKNKMRKNNFKYINSKINFNIYTYLIKYELIIFKNYNQLKK